MISIDTPAESLALGALRSILREVADDGLHRSTQAHARDVAALAARGPAVELPRRALDEVDGDGLTQATATAIRDQVAQLDGIPERGTVLANVSPCDGGGRARCGARTRIVKGFGVRVAGMVDLSCPRCGSVSAMRPSVVAEAR